MKATKNFMASKKRKNEPVKMQIRDCGLLVTNLPESLTGILCREGHSLAFDLQTGATLVKELIPIGTRVVNSNGRTQIFPIGMLRAIACALEAHGVPISLSQAEEVRPYQLDHPVFDTPLIQKLGDRHVAEFCGGQPLGLVILGDGVCPATTVAQVASAYPKARIALLAASVDKVNAAARTLMSLGFSVTTSTSGRRANSSARIVVGTNACLGDTNVAIEHVDFLFDLDALAGLSEHGKRPLLHAWRARKFGFLRLSDRVSGGEWSQLRGYFGFQQLEVPKHGECQRNLFVRWAEIWWDTRGQQDFIHNRLAAKLAVEMAKGTVPSSSSNCGLLQAQPYPRLRVVLLVESLGHAAQIAQRLPDWPVAVSKDASFEGLPGSMAALKSRCVTVATPGNCIATFAGADVIDWHVVDCVIRADGGTGLLPLPESALRAPVAAAANPLLIIDFDDRRNSRLGAKTRCRRRAYAEAGWHHPGADPVEERVKSFLEGIGH